MYPCKRFDWKVANLSEDQIFGEVSFLSGNGPQPAMATIKAVDEGTAVVYMDGKFIEELFTQDIQLALRFYKHMAAKLTARVRDVINPKVCAVVMLTRLACAVLLRRASHAVHYYLCVWHTSSGCLTMIELTQH